MVRLTRDRDEQVEGLRETHQVDSAPTQRIGLAEEAAFPASELHSQRLAVEGFGFSRPLVYVGLESSVIG